MTSQQLIAARCKRCYGLVATYVEGEPHPPGWWRLAHTHDRRGRPVTSLSCTCQPTPPLPDGDELAALVARARAKLGSPDVWTPKAPVRIRV